MNGLGIVVEESHYDDMLPPLPDSVHELSSGVEEIKNASRDSFPGSFHRDSIDNSSDGYDRDDTSDLPSSYQQSPGVHLSHGAPSTHSVHSTLSNSQNGVSNRELDEFHLISSSSNHSALPNEFVNYELDSPNLINQCFFDTNSSQTNSSEKPSSGLSRLKSLKKGIRKLSLSNSNLSSLGNTNNNSSSSNSLTSSSPEKRPNLNPLQTSSTDSAKFSFNSTATSISDKRSLQTDDIKLSKTVSLSSSTSGSPNNGSAKHSPTSSIVSANTVNTSTTNPVLLKSRAVSLSQPLVSPLTPPSNSSVITLSENLNIPKKAVLNIEQNYFDNLKDKSKITSIAELSTSSDLIEYSQYLIQQKNTLTEAFETAKSKLSSSGWCSSHDLNNLQLQQDTSVSQIDTKLLQIEEKLNREYNISLLGAVNKGTLKSSEPIKRGPSLQEIEGKYYQFS